MHYSAITTFILLIAAPVAMAGVAANPADGMNLFDTRATCLKNDCGGAGGCAGAWVSDPPIISQPN